MAKKQLFKDPHVVRFAEAVAAHKAGHDLEGMRGLIEATWDFWPEIGDAASGFIPHPTWGIFEERLKEAARGSLFNTGGLAGRKKAA